MKKVFKNDTQNLLESGFVNSYKLNNGLSIVYPKIPELIAFFGVEYIASLILKDYEEKTIEEIYKYFEKLCSPFLNGDIVATGVLLKIAEKGHVNLFTNLALYLLSLKPKTEKITDGTKAAMLIDGKTQVNIEFKGDGFEDSFIGNFFPHLVLSQLVGYPFELQNSDWKNAYDFHFNLILELAKNSISMVRISNFTFSNMPPIEAHEIDNIGTIICDRNGIIEPLVQSIQKCFYIIPEQIERLSEYAFDNNLFPVIWRIYLALKDEVDSVDKDISDRAKAFVDKFNKVFPDLFSKIIESLIHDEKNNKG